MLPVVRSKSTRPLPFSIISFGSPIISLGKVLESYCFEYPSDPNRPEDLLVGYVTAGFCSVVRFDECMGVWIQVREGGRFPEFAVFFPDKDTLITGWSSNIDSLWMDALNILESKGVDEYILDCLDCDPFFLFGFADQTAQDMILSLVNDSPPVLRCSGFRPTIAEWMSYLKSDPATHPNLAWIAEAFSEAPLPDSWSSFKNVASVICFIDQRSHQSTWKHPYYDYFAQLFSHCIRSSFEENIKLRVNRLFWYYEAESSADIGAYQPLISPKYTILLAEIFGVSTFQEGFLIRIVKSFLKTFSLQYRLEDELDVQEVVWSLEILKNERGRASSSVPPTSLFDSCGQIMCSECSERGSVFCPRCRDGFCESCFSKFHSHGFRKKHIHVRLIRCSACSDFPAQVQCTFSFGCYCPACYRVHSQSLPEYLDLRPLQIRYDESQQQRAADRIFDWHEYFDIRGIKYFYNFKTGESSRRRVVQR